VEFLPAAAVRSADVVILTNSGNGLRLCHDLMPSALGLNISPLKQFLF
jgi:hypothetical protein